MAGEAVIRGLAVELDRRPDYLRTPGRAVSAFVGPFEFYLSTADEGWLAFVLRLPGCKITWEWQGRPGA